MLRKDYNGNRGWIQGRVTNVSSCEADINLISAQHRSKIIEAFKAVRNTGNLTDAEIIKMACKKHTIYDSAELADLTKGVANELTLAFPELPSWRDVVIDRWSVDLSEFETKTKEEYSWKQKYE